MNTTRLDNAYAKLLVMNMHAMGMASQKQVEDAFKRIDEVITDTTTA